MKSDTVLYAEDEPSDIFFLECAFQSAALLQTLYSVPDGQQALDYLSGVGAFADREAYPLPCLVLLDINMPKKSGFVVLEWIRRQPLLKSLPVLILSSSAHPKDLARARQLTADDYLVKPMDPCELIGLVKSMRDRWLNPIRVGLSLA